MRPDTASFTPFFMAEIVALWRSTISYGGNCELMAETKILMVETNNFYGGN
jgi:hypothetical protein